MSGVIEHQAIGCKGSRKIINRCSTMNRSVPGLNLEKHSHGQRRGATNLEEKWSVAFVSAVSNARMERSLETTIVDISRFSFTERYLSLRTVARTNNVSRIQPNARL